MFSPTKETKMKKTYQLTEDLRDGETVFSTIELTEEQYELLDKILPWDIKLEEFNGLRRKTLGQLVEKLRYKAEWDTEFSEGLLEYGVDLDTLKET